MIELKEHNREPYKDLREKMRTTDRCAYISATGTGKSYVGGKLIEDEGYKALILVPSEEIRKGWKEVLPDVNVETYQSMHKADLEDVDLLICDEMHHLGADVWGRNFNGLVDGFTGKIVGMTATPVRFLDKGRNMVDELFAGEQVIGVELPEAIEKGILPTFEYVTALYNLPEYMPGAEYRNMKTEKLYAKLDAMSNSCSFQNILRKHIGGQRKVTVFVNSIEEIQEYVDIVRAVFPDAGHFMAHSQMSRTERNAAIEAFRLSESLSFLYTVDLLNEGVHIKGVDTVIMFRRTESPIIYLQQIGRALSADMEKERVLILDFVANHDNLKTSIGAGSSVIDWIRDGIRNPSRQIVVEDHAIEAIELIGKLRNQIFRLWDNSLDREAFYTDVKTFFPTEGGLEKLQEMYPDLRRNYIQGVANHLGLVERKKPALPDEVKQFIEEHPEMSTKEISLKFPECRRANISAYRNKLGIFDYKYVFTQEEDDILLSHPEMSCAEIQRTFFPKLGVFVVRKRRKQLGWEAPKREAWTEEKKERFCGLYVHGGTTWVQQDPLFSGLSSKDIQGRAALYDLRRDGRPVNINWSEDEVKILEDELRKPKENRQSFEEIADRMPRHTPLAVKRKMKRMMDRKETWLK